jgi:beta-glucosidase
VNARRLRFAGLLALLAAAFALAGCAAVRDSDATPFAIVTFNLYHDKADWPKRRALAIAELRALDADVVVLQEVLQHETLRNQAEDLAEALGYSAYFLSIDPPERTRRYGNAILTRHPVLARDWVALRPLQDSRTAGWVRIEVSGRPINVYVTHPNHRNDEAGQSMRSRQFADLQAFIARTAGDAPSIVAGDFNTVSGAPELAALEAGHDNAWDTLHGRADPRPTLNPHYFPDDARRIDHVYLQRGALRPLQARVVLDREGAPGVWPSDHFGLFVRFAFAPR